MVYCDRVVVAVDGYEGAVKVPFSELLEGVLHLGCRQLLRVELSASAS